MLQRLALLASVFIALSGFSGEAELGSARFLPNAERPVGWRGDGSGNYPGATPPLTWGRWIKGPMSAVSARPRSRRATSPSRMRNASHLSARI